MPGLSFGHILASTNQWIHQSFSFNTRSTIALPNINRENNVIDGHRDRMFSYTRCRSEVTSASKPPPGHLNTFRKQLLGSLPSWRREEEEPGGESTSSWASESRQVKVRVTPREVNGLFVYGM